MDPLRVTSGREWRRNREEGELIELPYCKRIVRIRTVRPDQLLRAGKIPHTLTNLVLQELYHGHSVERMDTFLSLQERAEDAMEMMESLRVVCVAALVAPRVVDDPVDDDEISIDDIDLYDRSHIFRLTFAPADALKRFRYGAIPDVETVPNGEVVPEPAL